MDKHWNEYNRNSWTFYLYNPPPTHTHRGSLSGAGQTVQGSICVRALSRVTFPH